MYVLTDEHDNSFSQWQYDMIDMDSHFSCHSRVEWEVGY